MNRFLNLFFIALIAVSCTDKKDNNPLIKNNTAPSLEIVGFAADTLVYVQDKSYPFEFTATDDSKDPEVSAKVIGGTGQVTFVDTTSDGLYTAEYAPFAKGQHQIELSISDGLAKTSEILAIFFSDNLPPIAVIKYTEINRDLENLTFTYEFDASQSSDKDSKISKVTWNLDGTALEKASIAQKFQHTFLYYANYKIDLTLEDEFGSKNTTSQTIDNSRPIARFEITPAAQAFNGDRVTCDADRSQSPNGQIESYKWFSKVAGIGVDILDEMTTNIFRYDVSMPVGENFIGLVVEDSEGNFSDTTWVKFTVNNTAPQAAFSYTTSLQHITITENRSSDIDPGDEITFSWLLNDSVLQDYEGQPTPDMVVRGAVYNLTLRVTDNHGASSESTIPNVSVPGVPEASFIISDINENNETYNGLTLTLDASSSIPGNGSRSLINFAWYWRALNSAPEVLTEDGSVIYSLQTKHPTGDYEVGLIVTNEDGLESERTWKKLIIVNSNPVVAFQASVRVQRTVVITSNNSSDVDPGQTINYFWFIDDVEQEADRGVKTPTWQGLPQGEHTIKLRVEDSVGGFAEDSTTVTTNF